MAKKSGNTIGNCGTVNTQSIRIGSDKGTPPTGGRGGMGYQGEPDAEAGTNGCGPMPGPRNK
jgi:hypothetical protein